MVLHVLELERALSPLLAAQTYAEYREAAKLALPRTPRVGDEYEKIILGYEKGEIRESLKRLQEYLEYENEEEMFASILETKPHASVLIRILGLVQAEFWEFKRRHNIYEFQDVAKMAIRLLEENPDIREYLREHTHEILIDEYQDTNDFQEILISLLAKDNVYMVGTSNSRFTVSERQSEIFKQKYRAFKQEGAGLAIDLSGISGPGRRFWKTST